MRRAPLLALVLVLALTRVSAQQPTAQDFEVVGQFGAETDRVVLAGRYAYLEGGAVALRVVDVSDPRQPVEVGSWRPYPQYLSDASDLAVAGTHVYLATRDAVHARPGFWVLDVADPRQPREVAFQPLGFWYGNWVVGIEAVGRYVYAAVVEDGLWVVDAADPAHPVAVGRYAAAQATGLAVHDGRAYLSLYDQMANTGSVVIVDLTDPARPTPIGAWHPPGFGQPRRAAIEPPHAYAVDSGGSLAVIGLCDPRQPTTVAQYTFPSPDPYARRTALGDGLAYVTDGGLLRAIDVRDPARPAQAGLYGTAGAPVYDAVTANGLVYAAATYEGLKILRFTGTLAAPTPLPSPAAHRLHLPLARQRC